MTLPRSLSDIGTTAAWSVIGLPSTDFGPGYAARNDVAAMEHRWLYLLFLLRRPLARVAVVTSAPVPPEEIDYLLGIVDTPGARERLLLASLGDEGPGALSDKLLRRPDVLAELRAWAGDGPRLILPFDGLGTAEAEVARALDTPLWAIDHRFAHHATKSGNRRLLKAAGVPVPAGAEDIRSERALRDAVRRLGLRRVVVKLDRGVTGDGNLVWDGGALPEGYRIERGAVVEELLDFTRSPSGQARIGGDGTVEPAGTHEQILDGHVYTGCRVPAHRDDHEAVERLTVSVAEHLAAQGAVGRLGVDFVTTADGPVAVEVNLREGATTHPVVTASALGGRYVRASDNVRAPGPVAWSDVRDELDRPGIVCFMQRSLEREGRLSVVAIGATPAECGALYEDAEQLLTRPRVPEPPGGR